MLHKSQHLLVQKSVRKTNCEKNHKCVNRKEFKVTDFQAVYILYFLKLLLTPLLRGKCENCEYINLKLRTVLLIGSS